jgi:hypothetical protein
MTRRDIRRFFVFSLVWCAILVDMFMFMFMFMQAKPWQSFLPVKDLLRLHSARYCSPVGGIFHLTTQSYSLRPWAN